jgi:transglutaminase-like putative cysteine protease
MQIRVGYELIYDCPQPTPMILTLRIHFTRVSDSIVPDHLIASPSIPITAYRDAFGNWCSRIVAPQGTIRLSADAVVNDVGAPDVVTASAQQHPVQDLPEETLVFLLGSRYCETDLLSEVAWASSAHHPPDGDASRPSAISSINISSLVTSTPAPRRRLGRLSMKGPASAVITRTSPSHSAAA